ncbi:Low-density lipoprotein receptor-related protein 5 [Thelohanellus kitauei]|uniref:Low-density lipoprotein receptor-related protein 5 n=1 Tax=Thelohanellus kitauei TaxID=669202 RepID=A0A0C2MM44_THEKT|nr:Low-density lipoprotein receptor-related protein 5 [Thelohanellus kitauei]KII71722.1 Low-density lipoprotein receptor-related protein 5 [Thelohanellus kitauei]
MVDDSKSTFKINLKNLKQIGFEVSCPPTSPFLCVDGDSCYSESQKCDGFMDCSDGSDERYCDGFVVINQETSTTCLGNEYFTCEDGKKLCMSKSCDGVGDCRNKKDEDMCGTICRLSR